MRTVTTIMIQNDRRNNNNDYGDGDDLKDEQQTGDLSVPDIQSNVAATGG